MKIDLQGDAGIPRDICLDVTSSHPTAPLMRFACDAMGTTFEVRLCCDNVAYGKQVARAAFELLSHLEQELSRFDPRSDVSRINSLKPSETIRVGLATFECLEISSKMNQATFGAFDVTVAPLCSLWKRCADSEPSALEIESTMGKTGMRNLILDKTNLSVGVLTEGVEVDLGGIGKGYAVDQMVEVLKDWGIESALIHGGQSSVYALGDGMGGDPWRLSFREGKETGSDLPCVFLQDFSLSGSGTFIQGRHVIDPRTGKAIPVHATSWALTARAVESDALSTAFLIMEDEEVQEYCSSRRGVFGVKCSEGGTSRLFGDWQSLR